jgi:hypothetical protein
MSPDLPDLVKENAVKFKARRLFNSCPHDIILESKREQLSGGINVQMFSDAATSVTLVGYSNIFRCGAKTCLFLKKMTSAIKKWRVKNWRSFPVTIDLSNCTRAKAASI